LSARHPARDSIVRVLAVIVNYRTADLVLGCIRSLAALRSCEDLDLEVVVANNRSGDACLERVGGWLADNQPFWPVRLAPPGTMSPRAIHVSRPMAPDLVWLLNPNAAVQIETIETVLLGSGLPVHGWPRAGPLVSASPQVTCYVFDALMIDGRRDTDLPLIICKQMRRNRSTCRRTRAGAVCCLPRTCQLTHQRVPGAGLAEIEAL
jgi:hypothetical protein